MQKSTTMKFWFSHACTQIIQEGHQFQDIDVVGLLPGVGLDSPPGPYNRRVWDHLAVPLIYRAIPERHFGTPEIAEFQDMS